MQASMLFLFAFICSVIGAPLDTRCFTDGILVDDRQMDHGIAEICIKDDISILKTTSRQIRNTTVHANSISRKMIIQNYEECNPIEVANGPIMIFRPTKDMVLVPHTYACRVECTISLDEEEANIVMHSDKLNHFEVMGTTTASKWFQGSTSYSLEHTCEHIQVTCGSNSLSFHACFKYHMACIRLMNKSYMPAFMIQSVCQNKELILMGVLVLIIFGLLYVMTLTYICYILVPVFYPFTYVWGLIYNKSCKKCYYCGLAYHPFTKCGKNCVCGCMFENSERMKAHRENGMCKGYKSLRAARILCKNRGSSLILAFILSFLLLSFIQPLEAIKLQYNNEIIEIDSVTKEFNELSIKLDEAQALPYVFISICILCIVYICVVMSCRTKLEMVIFKHMMYYCEECTMIHPKKKLRFFGDFTSKCNSCTCGTDYNNELRDNGDYMIVMDHELTEKCYIPGKYRAVRRLESFTTSLLLVVLIILFIVSCTYANTDCLKIKESKSIKSPVECSVWYKMTGSCTPTSIKELFKQISLPEGEIESIKESNEVFNMLKDSQTSPTIFKSYLLEEAILKGHCNQISDFNTKTGRFNKKMMSLMTSRDYELEVCATNKDPDYCDCYKESGTCSATASLTNSISFYKKHTESYKRDLKRVVNALMEVYPGLLARELALSMKATNLSKLREIANKMSSKFNDAVASKANVRFIEVTTHDSELIKLNLEAVAPRVIPYATNWSNSGIFENMAEATAIKECSGRTLYRCVLPISLRFEYVLTCGSEATKFYKLPAQGAATKKDNADILCVGDPFCQLPFTPLSPTEKDKLNAMVCNKVEKGGFDFMETRPVNKCKKMSTQTCLYDNANKTFMECQNGFFYEYTGTVYQAAGNDVGVYCFDKNCKSFIYPHHVDNLSGCKLHVINMKNRRLKEVVYENIEQLKHSIQEVIKTDLIEHKYVLTKDLPKISPSFRPLSIQGTETDDGVENAYIETNLIVRAGVSTGITLKAKDGSVLFDIILFIKSAHYEAAADYIYTTGPTVGINMQHDEQCTGSCPRDLKKEGWLSFYKEHTSTWGCEEYGCLAIGEGCVFGHCKDIIKPDLRVYKRNGDEIPKVVICATLPDGSYCHEISSFNPIISEKIEIQFLSNEAGRIPKLFGYKSNNVLTGMINDRGTFSKMCGSVQAINNDVIGAGNVRFDYICHAARRKEVTVSRCFDNFYESCLSLTTEKNMVFDDKTNKILNLNRQMGEVRIKLKLGDIRYKTFEKDPAFDLKGSCVGCLDCIKGMDCELDILASTDTVCPISSNCIPFHNNIRIEANTQKYGLKLKCNEETITIKVCSQEVEIMPTIVNKHETIEVGNSDQTYYVKEQDLKCGTWLCKVSAQGIGAIFSPFFNLFGGYGRIVFYSLLALLLLFVAIYILMPIFGRIADVLKNHEIEYIRETTGRKRHER
ncbi:glycoprotein precursor [Abras virus]|uniref:Envelopment polyprotein n=1 Tax=Abras virus TaxID=2303487 RepID=A0A346JIY1_9VIRU|nr:glycoprotein precursor [Abras virus]AXP33564.1 glycoprotein precursor [Abras virus]QLA47004.1 polyprotein [Abras virus]